MHHPQFDGNPIMTLVRLVSLTATLSLSSCLVTSTAPQPADFSLSEAALSQKYPAMRRTGTVRLYAQKIATTRDAWGRETHQATGGSLMVKGTTPPIFAEAPSISVTPSYSEAYGRSTVQKNDRLFIGQAESTSIRIDGAEIIPQGPVLIRAVASDAAATPAPATTPAAAPAPAADAPKTTPPPTQPEPPKAAAKPRPKSKPTQKAATPAKPSAPAAKPTAPKSEETPALNTSPLLNLLREPTER